MITAPTFPTAASMKFKFPAFRGIDDGVIEFAIEEAMVVCGDGDWVNETNRTLGVALCAAHLLQVALMRSGAGGTGQIVSSERTPDLSVTYAVPNQNTAIDFTMTIYGERFYRLLRANFPAVLTVNTGVPM